MSAVKTLTRDVMHENSTIRNQRKREGDTALALSAATNRIAAPLVKLPMKDSTVHVQGRGKSRRAGKTFPFDRVTPTFLLCMRRNRIAAKSRRSDDTRPSMFQRSRRVSPLKLMELVSSQRSSPPESFIDLSYRSPWSVRITDDVTQKMYELWRCCEISRRIGIQSWLVRETLYD